MAAKRCLRNLWESEFQWKARSKFIETWKNNFPDDRLASLSMVWANMKFLGCRYPAKTEELVNVLESKGLRISLPKAGKTTSIGNFMIYELEEGDKSAKNNSVSAQKTKVTISFVVLGETYKTALYSCAAVIADKVIAVGEGTGEEEARRNAAEKCLKILSCSSAG